MDKEASKKKLMEFAFDQLKNIAADIKTGKTPTASKKIKAMTDIVAVLDKKIKENKITEEELDIALNDIAKDL